jgi:hypothetical protein
MSLYHPGYPEAMARIETLDEEGLYELFDDLFGRDNLPDDPTIEDLREEARRQTKREFKDESAPGWDYVELFTAIHRTGGFPQS